MDSFLDGVAAFTKDVKKVATGYEVRKLADKVFVNQSPIDRQSINLQSGHGDELHGGGGARPRGDQRGSVGTDRTVDVANRRGHVPVRRVPRGYGNALETNVA